MLILRTKRTKKLLNRRHKMTHDDVLQHFGILGMHWGKVRDKSFYKAKKDKVKSKNEKYGNKIAKLEVKSSKILSKVAKKENKFKEQTVNTFSGGMTPHGIKKLRNAARKLKQLNKKYSKLTKRVARYKMKVESNKQLIRLMDKRVSEIDKTSIKIGKRLVDAAIN